MKTFEEYEAIAHTFKKSLFELHTKRVKFEQENSEYIPSEIFGQNWYIWKTKMLDNLELPYQASTKRNFLKNWNEGNFVECDRILKLLDM